MPVRALVTEGTTADCTQAIALIDGFDAGYLLADRGYDTNSILEHVERQGISAVIAHKWKQSSVQNKASAMARKPLVAERINAIKQELADREIRKIDEEKERLIGEISRLAYTDLPTGDMGHKEKIRALELLGKVLGIFEKDNKQKSVQVKTLMEIIQGAQTHGVGETHDG